MPVKNYYELLELPRTASADDIKRAFRREIAKYHPDKVQHLGREFQDIAVEKAAELTLAYKTLSDTAARADYDAQLEEGGPGAPAVSPAPARPSPAEPTPSRPASYGRQPAGEPEPVPTGAAFFAQERAATMDLVRRATLARFQQALTQEFGRCDERPVPGFEITCLPKAGGFFSRRTPPAVLGRFLAQVDAAAVTETWGMAVKMRSDAPRDVCVFLMGPAVAAAGELARAIAEQRRKPAPAGTRVVMIPVNTKTWQAHVPTDAPPVVKSLLTRLQSA